MDFQYKVTVIVPVYNAAEYLRACLDSLVAQTIDHSLMEVLLINDGSTDSSLSICQEYEILYSFFKVYSQENMGVSAARNLGIMKAEGQYMMFLDADDMLAPETVKSSVAFFEQIWDQVDVVTYKRVFYKDGKALPLHFRYKYLNKTGIYDLNEYCYVSQTTLNIVTKNRKDILFDTSLKQGEDQKYVTELLLGKMKIGYSNEGEYKYIIHEGSAAQSEAYSYYLFEQHTKIWEDLFEKFEVVPKYIQGLVLANYRWELNSDCIFPYHYKGEEYTRAVQRIKDLFARIDTDVIMNHPQIDNFHKHFWVSFKEDIHPVVLFEKENMKILVNGESIYQRENMEIVLNKISAEKDVVSVLGFVKSPVFNYIKELPQVIAVLNQERINVPVFESINSCYKTKAHTNFFWGFRFSFSVNGKGQLTFLVKIDGIEYETQFYCVPTAVFNKKLGVNSFTRGKYIFSLEGNVISVVSASAEEQINLARDRKYSIEVPQSVKLLRNKVIEAQNHCRIWLYSDSHAIGEDNAFYQFQHDIAMQDGIFRYYVCDENKEEIEKLVPENQRNFLLDYGTEKHKTFYLKAEYVICSFSDIRPRIPFTNDAEFAWYRDLPQPTVIYLQHGVLHADLRWLQSAERCKVDKIVVSTEFEKKNLVEKYHYMPEDILPFGMPRFDNINKNAKPKNKIIFAPSWRSYLMEKNKNAVWEGNLGQLLKSRYLNKFISFLQSQRLYDFLEANDLTLDAKLHPHMRSIIDVFDIQSDRINITRQKVNLADYKIFITDISSFVFDYVYLSRPVVYFVPDLEEFESGMNHYRKLDLPFEKAFGNLVIEPDDAIDELRRIAENNFTSDQKYRERMDNFFLPLSNCRCQLYNYLLANNESLHSKVC